MNKFSTIVQAPGLASTADPVAPDAPPRRRGSAPRWIAAVLAGSLAVLAALLWRAGLTVAPLGNLPVLAGVVVALLTRLVAPRLRWRHARAIGHCAEYYAAFAIIALMGAIASYPVSALTHGYSDASLQRIDAALGFDWLAWYRAVAASPALQALGTAAYRSIYVSPAILLAWFAGTGQRAEAYRFVLLFWLSAVITLTLFSFMPALGPFSYLWHGPIPYMPESELWQPDLIPRLRAHSVHVIDPGALRGLVSAPSFHSVAAILYGATAWRVRRLRWPLIALNVAMLLSTPVEGTHYLADILLGIVVAGVTLGIVRLGGRRSARTL